MPACHKCPFKNTCMPDQVEDWKALVENVAKAKNHEIPGFGRPLPQLEVPGTRVMTCVEKSRAIARAWEVFGLSNRTEYLLWISWNGAFHLSPVDTDNMQVLEQGTEDYHELGFTPVIVLPTCPWGMWSSIRLDPHEAYNLPTIPIDRKVRILADLGYGEVRKTSNTHEHLDTGMAKIYRVVGERTYGVLVWFKTDDVFVISKDPYDQLATALNNMNRIAQDYWPNR